MGTWVLYECLLLVLLVAHVCVCVFFFEWKWGIPNFWPSVASCSLVFFVVCQKILRIYVLRGCSCVMCFLHFPLCVLMFYTATLFAYYSFVYGAVSWFPPPPPSHTVILLTLPKQEPWAIPNNTMGNTTSVETTKLHYKK
jgi:hypothetical protein